MAKSIDVSDVNIYYGDFLAVQGVNMTVRAGAVTARARMLMLTPCTARKSP